MKRIAATVAVVVASCGMSQANEPNRKLLALADEARHSAFAGYVRQSGQDCETVDRSMLLNESVAGRAVWSVACRNGKDYVVTVSEKPEDRPFVMTCDNVRGYGRMMAIMDQRMGQPATPVAECWKKF